MSMCATPQVAQVGDHLPDMHFGPITRAQLGLYAGASLDHDPIHIDIDFAKSSGHPDVFAHGMLGMAQFGRLLTNWAGAGSVTSLSTRFTALVPVGATLRVSGVVDACDQPGDEITLTITLQACLQDETRVLTGQATLMASAEASQKNQKD